MHIVGQATVLYYFIVRTQLNITKTKKDTTCQKAKINNVNVKTAVA